MKPNGENERLKREYFQYLREAHGRDEATIDGVAKALARFEDSTACRTFKRFHREQAVAFKRQLADAVNGRTGERLSKSTLLTTMRELRAFFFWLAHLPGFKSHISYADADYFNLSDKDVAIARAQRERPVATIEQVRRVIDAMPVSTALERRDRALIAFTLLTGARASALASIRLGHVDMTGGYVDQDARVVRTKGSKSFRTFFFQIDKTALSIVAEWTVELERDHLWGPGDPLFPATEVGLDARHGTFAASGLARRSWQTTGPINEVFRRAFACAGLPYFNPHSFRAMLVRYAMAIDLTPEEMKAWSQNLGHANVMTTLTSYGQVPTHRQGELIRAMQDGRSEKHVHIDAVLLMESALAAMKASGRR
jgi:integrase